MPHTVRAAQAFHDGSTARLRILVVCASPLVEGTPLDLRGEWLRLKTACERGRLPVTLFRLLPPTREELENQLQEAAACHVAPHVLHFAGHGEPHHLSLEDDLGNRVRYARDELAQLLRNAHVPVVVLNACHTATRSTVGFAQALTEGDDPPVGVAIGHTHPVPDEAAVAFAGAFYTALARGETALMAWHAGKQAMRPIDDDVADAVQLFGDETYAIPVSHVAAEARVFDGTTGRVHAPEVPHFYGRVDELTRLGKVLADPNILALALCGVGGIGKTTLALELVNRHAWRFPGGVVFITTRTLFEAPTAEALVTEAAALLGANEKDVPPLRVLLQACRTAPTLVVFDNLEDLPDAELSKLIRVLEQLPPNGSKVVLTLRPATGGLDEWAWLRVERVTAGLSLHAAAALVAREAHVRGVTSLQGALRDGSWEGPPLWLAQAVSGHPKMLEVAVGTAATGGLDALRAALPELTEAERSTTAVYRLAAETMEHRMTDLLSTCVRALGDDGQKVLQLTPLFPAGSVSAEEGTAAMTALQTGEPLAHDADAAIRTRAGQSWALGAAEAVRAALFAWDTENGLWRFHPVVAGHAERSYPLGETYSQAWSSVFREAIRYVSRRLDDPVAIEQRITHLFALFEQAWTLGQESEELRNTVAAAVDALGYHLYRRGYWRLLERWRTRLYLRTDESITQRAHRLYKEALLLQGRGQLVEAHRILEESISIAKTHDGHQARAACLFHLAIIEHSQGHTGEARRLLLDSISIAETIGDRRGHAASLYQLATFEDAEGNLDAAYRLVRDSVSILDELGDRQNRAAPLHMLSMLEYQRGNCAEARRLVIDSISIHEEFGDRRGLAASLHMLATLEYGQGNRDQARRLLLDSITIAEELGDRQGRAISLNRLAMFEIARGNPAEARRLLLDSISTAEEIGDHGRRAASLNQLATLENDRGAPAEAKRLLLEAISIVEKLGDRKGQAATLHQLSILEHAQGNLSEASRLLRVSLSIRKELGDRQSLPASLHQLAAIENAMGRPNEARRLLHDAISLAEELGTPKTRAASLHQLANIEWVAGDLNGAHRLYTESSAIARELGDLHGLALTLIQLGQLNVKRGDRPSGTRQIREAIALLHQLGVADAVKAEQILRGIEFQAAPQIDNEVEGLLNDANDAIRRNAHAHAAEAARRVLALLSDRQSNREPEARFLLGQALVGLSQRDEALLHLQRARELLEATGRVKEAEIVRRFTTEDSWSPSPEQIITSIDNALADPALPTDHRPKLHATRIQALITNKRYQEAIDAVKVAQREAAATSQRETLSVLEQMNAVANQQLKFQQLLATPLATIRAMPLPQRAAALARRSLALVATAQPDLATALLPEAEACLPNAEVGSQLDALLILAQARNTLGDPTRALEHITAAEHLAACELPHALSFVQQIKQSLNPTP